MTSRADQGAAAMVSTVHRRTETPTVRALVVLAGSVRPSDLSRAIDSSLLDLPVVAGATVLSLWIEQARLLAERTNVTSLPMRVVIDQTGPAPMVEAADARAPVTVERDPADFRGTGGVLRDSTSTYGPDDRVLLATGAQVLTEPLPGLVDELWKLGGEIALVAHADGTPSGLFLVRVGALAGVNPVGFVDLKEQFLPRLASHGADIRVLRRATATGIPVRTLDGYLAALRSRASAGDQGVTNPFAEDWATTFSLVDPAARVDPTATVHDSVVLRGGVVERGATVVRSVVGPRGIVKAGQTVADSVIGAGRERTRGAA
ncbi:MAG: hypothetical protein ACKVW3_07760 [Phycisphaerales bacterium]